MRNLAWWLSASLALAALGCAGGGNNPLVSSGANNPVPGTDAVSNVDGSLGGVQMSGDLSMSALAVFSLDVDPGSLTAASRLKETRKGAANSDLYLLSIGNFINDGSFKVTGVEFTPEGVDLEYRITHPFSGPSNLDGTPTAANRADLGIAGMALFLADVPSATGNTYFDDGAGSSVIANTGLISNADAYYTPNGLLTTTGGTANTFPYKSLVDELADGTGSRADSVSNAGDVTGNFGADGWTKAEIGATAPYNQWTGFGVLHQGQAASNTVSINSAALSGPFSLDVAILAKYNDPRAGATPAAKKANRLPPATPDALTGMAYRMPHGALDVESIQLASVSGNFTTNAISAATLNFHVVDWDARATESTEASLSLDADVTKVATGESGLPDFAVCIPGVLGDATVIDDWDPGTTVLDDDSAEGGDAATDSGRPGDGLFYSKSVTHTQTSGQTDGDYTGMARATDPEELLASPLAFALDPDLALLTANLPSNTTYQSFTVSLATPNTPPSANLAAPAGQIASGNGVTYFDVTLTDPDASNTLQVRFDWNGNASYADTGEGWQTISAPATRIYSPIFYNNATLSGTTIPVNYEYTDNVISTPLTGSANFNLGPNQAPTMTGTPGLASQNSPATFTMTGGTLVGTDPEGDTISYQVIGSVAPLGPFPAGGSTTFPGVSIGSIGPYTIPGGGPMAFRLYARDPLHTNTSSVLTTASANFITVNTSINCPGVPAYSGTNIVSGPTPYNAGAQPNPGTSNFGQTRPSLDFAGTPYMTIAYNSVCAGGYSTAAQNNIYGYYSQNCGYPCQGNTLNTNFSPVFTKRPNQIDVDPLLTTGSAYRYIWSACSTSYPTTANSYGDPASIYAATGAEAFLYYADGTQAVPATTYTTIPLAAGNRVVAMTTDQIGNIYTLDQNHVLHRYIKANNYTEDTNAPYPANLISILGDPNGTAGTDSNVKVHDFVMNFRGGNFFFLLQTQGAQPNGRLLRVECDLTAPATVAGNPNPAIVDLGTSTNHTQVADIIIKQNSSTSATFLATQGEAQLIIGGQGTSATFLYWNTNLVNTGSYTMVPANGIANLRFGHFGYMHGGNNQNANSFHGSVPSTNLAPSGWLGITTNPAGWQ